MFHENFGLAVNPFGIAPRLDFLYRSGAFEESMAHLVYGLDNSEAIVMITGAIGTGKTMAIQSFLSHLGDRYVSALITNTTVDGKELLKLVFEDLGLPPAQGADKSDLLIAFKNFMVENGRLGKRIVIVVDEAQNLTREVLEEIRLLTNLGQGAEQPVQIILVGQPELETTVQRPDLAQLKQRIRVHYKLATLTRQEMEEYVDHRMQVAGGSAGIFGGGALDRIYEISGGVPRVVNTLCGDALLAAYVGGRRKVEAKDVEDPSEVDVVVPERAVAGTPEEQPDMDVRKSMTAMSERSEPVARRPQRPRAVAKVPRQRVALWIASAAVAGVAGGLIVTGQVAPLWSRLAPSGAPRVEPPEEVVAALPAAVADTEAAIPDLHTAVVESVSTVVPAAVDPGPESVREDTPPPSKAPDVEPAPAVADMKETSRPAAADVAAKFYIHVASFRMPERALMLAGQFKDAGLEALVRQQTVRGVFWYRIYLGSYGTHDEAVHHANQLRENGTITYYKVIQAGTDEGL